MEWTQRIVDRLDVALNEADFAGVTVDEAQNRVEFRIEVLTLPESLPTEADVRRILVLTDVASIWIALRTDERGQFGPVTPLDDWDAVNHFIDEVDMADAWYGWAFFDIIDPTPWWSGFTPSIEAQLAGTGEHTLRWHVDCHRDGISYVLQCMTVFGSVHAELPDGTVLSADEFAAGGVRWWDGFNGRGDLEAFAAKQELDRTSPRWRHNETTSQIVPAGDWPTRPAN